MGMIRTVMIGMPMIERVLIECPKCKSVDVRTATNPIRHECNECHCWFKRTITVTYEVLNG